MLMHEYHYVLVTYVLIHLIMEIKSFMKYV